MNLRCWTIQKSISHKYCYKHHY